MERETVIEMLMPNHKESVFYSNNSEHILHDDGLVYEIQMGGKSNGCRDAADTESKRKCFILF